MLSEESEETLLEKAELEEKNCNWNVAALLYKKAAKSFQNNKKIVKAAKTYYKVGSTYIFASDSAETAEDYRDLLNNSSDAYKEALNLFKLTGFRAGEFECKASYYLIESFFLDSGIESYKKLYEALKFLNQSYEVYSFFANIGEFGESLIYTPEKDRTERFIPAKEEGLIFKDIDLFKLRSKHKKWGKEQNKERLFIQSTR